MEKELNAVIDKVVNIDKRVKKPNNKTYKTRKLDENKMSS